MSKWKKYSVSELCSDIIDCVNKTAPIADTETPYKMLRTSDIRDGFINIEGLNCVTEEVFQKWIRRGKLQVGDIVFTREAPLGEVGLVREATNYFLGQRLVLYRTDSSVCDNRFLMYWFLNPVNKAGIKSRGVGATVTHLRVPECEKIEITAPSIDIQHRIADILSSYDDLIENNRKQIKLLEEAAQRLYKAWFVDLRFPGHEETPIVDGVPAGWERKRADTFFEITIGKTPPRAEKQWFTSGDKGVPWLSISDMGNAGVYAFYTSEGLTEEAVKKHNMKIVPIGTIFVSFKLTVGRVAIANTDMCTNEAIAHFYIKDDIYRPYTYCYLRNFEYDTLGNTSSISKAVNSKIIKSMPFVMPDRDTISSFSEMVSPILDEINNKQKACLRLIESRDRLLPKLMSGEIEV